MLFHVPVDFCSPSNLGAHGGPFWQMHTATIIFKEVGTSFTESFNVCAAAYKKL
jgi:hypothetical protein